MIYGWVEINVGFGYLEVNLFATLYELDVVIGEMGAVLMLLLKNEVGNGYRKYKVAAVIHPVFEGSLDGQDRYS